MTCPLRTRELAEQGVASAQFNLGLRYAIGQDAPKNPRTACEWFEKAALQGFAAAMFYLGLMHSVGAGVPKNNVHAFAWLSAAAAMGDDKAKSKATAMQTQLPESRITKARDLAAGIIASLRESALA